MHVSVSLPNLGILASIGLKCIEPQPQKCYILQLASPCCDGSSLSFIKLLCFIFTWIAMTLLHCMYGENHGGQSWLCFWYGSHTLPLYLNHMGGRQLIDYKRWLRRKIFNAAHRMWQECCISIKINRYFLYLCKMFLTWRKENQCTHHTKGL